MLCEAHAVIARVKVKEIQNNSKQGHEFAIMELGKQSKVSQKCGNQI